MGTENAGQQRCEGERGANTHIIGDCRAQSDDSPRGPIPG